MTLNDLLDYQIRRAIESTMPEKKIGLAFSGGVDSTLIAKLCSDMGYDVTLLTIGFDESHDIEFSKIIASYFSNLHKILTIEPNTFPEISKKIHEKIQTENLSWNENCIAFYYISKLARENDIDTVITANGIDELFCGYNSYRLVFDNGPQEIIQMMDSKLDNEIQMMNAVNLIASEFSVKILQPLLSDEFISFAKTIPLSEKIHSSEDLIRKHAVRKYALHVGVPEISANKRKKALQYGSKIHKNLLKSR